MMAAALLVSVALGQFSMSPTSTRTSSLVAHKEMYAWWCADKVRLLALEATAGATATVWWRCVCAPAAINCELD